EGGEARKAVQVRQAGEVGLTIGAADGDAFRRLPFARFDVGRGGCGCGPADLGEIRDHRQASIVSSMRSAAMASQNTAPSVGTGRRSASSVDTGRSVFCG